MNRGTRRIIAFAMVAAFIAVSISPVLPSADAAAGETYVIDMRTGDLFSYTPRTNMESEISSSQLEGAVWNTSTGTLSARFAEPDLSGSLWTRVTAVWTSEGGHVTQEIHQDIVFMVHPHVTIDGSSDGTIIRTVQKGATEGTVVYKPTVSVASDGTVTSVICTGPTGGYVGWDDGVGAIVVQRDIPSDIGYTVYRFTVSATNTPTSPTSTLATETATMEVTVSVGGGFSITSPSEMELAKGDGITEYTIDTNAVGLSVTSVTAASDVVGFVSVADGKVMIDPSVIETGSKRYVDVPVDVSVSGTVDGTEVSASQTLTIRVWKELGFDSVPEIRSVSTSAYQLSGLSMMVSADIGGAERVTIDWDDGEVTVMSPGQSERYNADHTYSKDGSYVIRLTAENPYGSSSSYILYDTMTGTAEPTEPPRDSGLEVWMVFATLSVVLWAAYFLVRPTMGTAVASVLTTFLAVLFLVVVG